ncbi:sensor histidine kinase [Sphingomonas jatrophae]|uniref:histidine kinase n=1 Tax=Sphingomonas jatrophae TaxID=1166337 RepID=A0A1I6LMJ6_9SPHN|nr:histidine kinase dimerization/phosphoacceptor domain -containing protein [Sphingomonas jatrophae]SFS04665.1 Two-component sensor histidine kinase, contains HisKA and HATPase domains [Sphingomonas jatrophae]
MSDRPRHILYIDDDDGLRRLTARALARRGFEVTTAGSGPEGVALAQQGRFDLIAIDHYMPGMDGLATLAELQALPDLPPVVYVTGSEESRIAVAALKAGATEYVVKSIGDDFFDLLAAAFEGASEQVGLRRAKEEAEDALRASNARLEALLREVNHRVANSLQLVTAFVQMQARELDDPAARAALEDTQSRITAIAQVHRRLYTSDDVETVEMGDYLGALLKELEDTWSTPAARRTLRLDAEPIRLKTDRAVSVGVIVNELVSNACKYAYQTSCDGEIRVQLRQQPDDSFLLAVEDDGCGMPVAGAPRGTGLGTKLIRAMAASLGTAVEFDLAHRGVRATLQAAC